MKTGNDRRRALRRVARSSLAVAALLGAVAMTSVQDGGAMLEETRLTMGKWIETQQVISRERKDWQQGKEILSGRVELVRKELEGLQQKLSEAHSSVEESAKKKQALLDEKAQLDAAAAQLEQAVTSMERDVVRLYPSLPEPLHSKLDPLRQRIPEDPTKTKISIAERFQNVLGILNEVNKANSEITVNYEVHTLADGKPSEVRALYIGLAQAYYVSARNEAGVGHPSPEGWKWEPSPKIAADVVTALEILQGKHSPAFVPLPVTIQ